MNNNGIDIKSFQSRNSLKQVPIQYDAALDLRSCSEISGSTP